MTALRSLLIALAFSGAVAAPAYASSFNFNVLYSGNGNAALAVGSDDPVGRAISPGDSFLWTITATNGEWHVDVTRDYFPLMAFPVQGHGERTGDWTLNLLNGGASVFTASDSGPNSIQDFAHMGTNEIGLTSGLVFDDMQLNYTLNGYVPNVPPDGPAGTTIQGLLPYLGAPEQNEAFPGISYVTNPIPEPSTYALMLAGLAGVGFMARRRKI
jgi:hypothetical protein